MYAKLAHLEPEHTTTEYGFTVHIGDCMHCNRRKVLIGNPEEGFCSYCISQDPFLTQKFKGY